MSAFLIKFIPINNDIYTEENKDIIITASIIASLDKLRISSVTDTCVLQVFLGRLFVDVGDFGASHAVINPANYIAENSLGIVIQFPLYLLSV